MNGGKVVYIGEHTPWPTYVCVTRDRGYPESRRYYQRETCRWEYPQGANGWVGYIVCSNCQHQFSGVDEREWTCCPVCGARVEGADGGAMSSLLPCPFCGGEARTRLDGDWWVVCSNCTCEIGFMGMDENGCQGHYPTEAEAVEAWNTRHVDTCRNVDADQGWFECSECKCICSVDWYGSGFGTPKFCPSCGKKVEQ